MPARTPTITTLNSEGLARMRDEFLRQCPDFGDFTERSGNYWVEEREYKDELSGIARATLTPTMFNDDSPAGAARVLEGIRHVLLGKLPSINRPQNLASWRYTDFLRRMSDEENRIFARALGTLLFDNGSDARRAGAFSAVTWPIQKRIAGGNPYAQARLIPTLFLMLLHPKTNITVRTDVFKRAARQLVRRKLLQAAPFSENEYQDVLDFSSAVRLALESWAWCPRDMIDVHSFLWMTTRVPNQGSATSDDQDDD